MNRIKKLTIILTAMLFVGTTLGYAALIDMTAGQDAYRDSIYDAIKNTKDNSAIVNLTSGPDRVNAPLECFVARYENGSFSNTYKTDIVTISYCGSKKIYYANPFDYTLYTGRNFRAAFKIVTRSRFYSVNVKGYLTS